MSLDQIANIAEISAAALIIVSLIYVARQLGQNTAMMRAGASDQRVQRDAELSYRVSDSQEFTEIWLKGIADFQSLGEVERTRLIFFSRSAIVHWHNMFRLRGDKLLPDSDWNELIWLIQHIGLRQDLLEAWRMFKNSFDKSFQEFLDAQFSAALPLS